MIRYELIPVTHKDLLFHCRLGGVIFVPNDYLNAQPPQPYFKYAVRVTTEDPMRADVYLIGGTVALFQKLPEYLQKQLFKEAALFAQGRHDTRSPKNNGRILVIHDD